MRLTVLGSSGSYPGPGHACSGYLIETEGATVLMDAGNGTIANAAVVTDVARITAALVSHTHVDHFLDLYALEAALRFAPAGPVGSMPLHLPEGLWERMRALLSSDGAAQLAEAFTPHTIADGVPMLFGPVTITPHLVDHVAPTFAFVVESEGGKLVYTADTRDGSAVRAVAAGADVLLAECTLPTEYAGRGPHLTPGEAGDIATEAGASLLVLTHLWPTADRDALVADAGRTFKGEILAAEELMTIDIAPVPGTGEGA
jgi:ribonuclease BN (tRNA processing enzyme)